MEDKVQAKTVFSGAIWRFGERILAQVVSFFVSIILARILLPEEYGVVSLTTILITLCNVFVTSGFGTALIQKKDADSLDFSTILIFGLVASIGVYFILFFLAPILADFFNQPILTLVIRVMSLRLPLAAINSVQQAYISRKMMFKKFFWGTFGGTAVSAVLGVVLAYRGYGVWSIVVQYLSNCFIDTLILFLVVGKIPKLKFSTERFKGLFGFGWRVLCSDFIATAYTQLRGLIIGKTKTSTQLAYYNKGEQIPHLFITNSSIAISTVLFPAMAKEQNEKDRLKHILKRSVKVSMYVILPIMAGLAIVAEPLIKLLLTEKWLGAVPFLQLSCLIYVVDPWVQVNLQAMKALGQGKSYLKLEIIKKAIAFALLFISIPFGVYAIVLSAGIYSIIALILTARVMGKEIGYGFGGQLKDISLDIFKVVLMVIVVYPLKYVNLDMYIIMTIQIGLGILIYLLLSLVMKSENLKYIVYLIGKLFSREGKNGNNV
ncbi:MAG: lipopolysaccharide biosynthesis protein [Clostridia bacterium]|nr:lipopolysaccharide biosynthesis protein [Clostridia bacterium]